MNVESITPLPVVLPLLIGALILIVEKIIKRRVVLDSLTVLTAAIVVILDLCLLYRSAQGSIVYWFGGWKPVGEIALGIAFVIDPLGAGLAALTGTLTLLALIYSWHYFDAIGPFFHSLMLVFLASMTGFCLTGDLFNLFVFFELMGVAAYALTGYKIEDTGPLEGALNFSVMNSIGAIMVLAGIALIYGRTGALNMAQAGITLSAGPPDYLVFLSFGLLVIGFFVKAAIVPFHFWLPDAHAVSPTPVSVLFSGVMVELGIYAAARVYWTMYHGALAGHEAQLREMLMAVGLLTCLIGAVMCFAQRHLKRMLAFSTVSHAGIMTVGVGMLDSKALAGASLYLLGHGLIKGALFICAGIILHRTGSVDEISLHGRGKNLKKIGAAFFISGIALAGFLPFGIFTGKSLMEEAALSFGYHSFTYVAITGSALTAGAVLRAASGIFLGWGRPGDLVKSAPAWGDREIPETIKTKRWTPFVMWGPAFLAIIFCLCAGILPDVAEKTPAAAGRFTDNTSYISTVLARHPEDKEITQTHFQPGPGAFLKSVLSLLAAIVIAAAATQSYRLPQRLRSAVWRIMRPPFTLLRVMHSGLIMDYVVWFMVGAAIVSSALVVISW